MLARHSRGDRGACARWASREGEMRDPPRRGGRQRRLDGVPQFADRGARLLRSGVLPRPVPAGWAAPDRPRGARSRRRVRRGAGHARGICDQSRGPSAAARRLDHQLLARAISEYSWRLMALANVIGLSANLTGAGRLDPDADRQDMVPSIGIRGPLAPRRGCIPRGEQDVVPCRVRGVSRAQSRGFNRPPCPDQVRHGHQPRLASLR